ncbi:MAG: hypothetical protein GY719_08460 [bacterium]|nr:hypothetical protein [bacterium]
MRRALTWLLFVGLLRAATPALGSEQPTILLAPGKCGGCATYETCVRRSAGGARSAEPLCLPVCEAFRRFGHGAGRLSQTVFRSGTTAVANLAQADDMIRQTTAITQLKTAADRIVCCPKGYRSKNGRCVISDTKTCTVYKGHQCLDVFSDECFKYCKTAAGRQDLTCVKRACRLNHWLNHSGAACTAACSRQVQKPDFCKNPKCNENPNDPRCRPPLPVKCPWNVKGAACRTWLAARLTAIDWAGKVMRPFTASAVPFPGNRHGGVGALEATERFLGRRLSGTEKGEMQAAAKNAIKEVDTVKQSVCSSRIEPGYIACYLPGPNRVGVIYYDRGDLDQTMMHEGIHGALAQLEGKILKYWEEHCIMCGAGVNAVHDGYGGECAQARVEAAAAGGLTPPQKLLGEACDDLFSHCGSRRLDCVAGLSCMKGSSFTARGVCGRILEGPGSCPSGQVAHTKTVHVLYETCWRNADCGHGHRCGTVTGSPRSVCLQPKKDLTLVPSCTPYAGTNKVCVSQSFTYCIPG